MVSSVLKSCFCENIFRADCSERSKSRQSQVLPKRCSCVCGAPMVLSPGLWAELAVSVARLGCFWASGSILYQEFLGFSVMVLFPQGSELEEFHPHVNIFDWQQIFAGKFAKCTLSEPSVHKQGESMVLRRPRKILLFFLLEISLGFVKHGL